MSKNICDKILWRNFFIVLVKVGWQPLALVRAVKAKSTADKARRQKHEVIFSCAYYRSIIVSDLSLILVYARIYTLKALS